MSERAYIAIDLKSFYASVECMERDLDPMTTHLVVADPTRTEKTICLAVSPSLKAYGVPGRPRLFEVIQKVRAINYGRQDRAPGGRFRRYSCNDTLLRKDPSLGLEYLIAPPQMARYMQVSTEIYNVYLKYIAPEDIHVYSIDEVFIDATHYLKTYNVTPRELAMRMIRDVLKTTGITATAGIGTNLYLAKVAMDIVAKHMPADKDGVRIAELDEMSYRKTLWMHRPLTDFWRVGKGIARRLEENHLFTMGDVARCSVGGEKDYYNEDLLYKLFGVNAELLIDHAWGWEPCTIADIRAFKPENNSLSCGQVLKTPYTHEDARLVVREMSDSLSLDLVEKGLVADQVVLTVCYDIENLTDPKRREKYKGPITTDYYGRSAPKAAHSSENIGRFTSSSKSIIECFMTLFDRIVDPELLVRRIYVVANHVMRPEDVEKGAPPEQLDLFTDYAQRDREQARQAEEDERENRMQKAMLGIRNKYGKNSILKGMNLKEGATIKERNGQIGGHRA